MSIIKTPKKLIEVALPLDDINLASVREKSIRHGHPSTLHLWWARRPLATARAVLFAQLVNDPGYDRSLKRGLKKEEAQKERERLFQIIRDLVKWENTNNEEVLERAREEIRRSWRETCELNKDHPQSSDLFNPDKLPAFHDPFAGGGALPLEAQRLGLETYASDLNPVAVMINKAMIEIPPKFANRPPVGPVSLSDEPDLFHKKWIGANGLAEDVRRYGAWIRTEAEKKIGNLYPKIEITLEMAKERPDLKAYVGQRLTAIAWLWSRTVKSPNPAFSHVDVPLTSTFVMSSKIGKEAWIEPIVQKDRYDFVVHMGKPPKQAETGTKLARGAKFRCLLSDTAIDPNYIKSEGLGKRIGARLMTVVVEGEGRRLYLSPNAEIEKVISHAKSNWRPDLPLPNDPRNFWTLNYGLTTFGDLFTERQLVALTTFSDFVFDIKKRIRQDAIDKGMSDATGGLESDDVGATAYAEAVTVYLAFAVDRLSNACSSLVSWISQNQATRNTFARQSLPMVWDYTEINPLSSSTGNWMDICNAISESINYLPSPMGIAGHAQQADAQNQIISFAKVVSTDPPYYDNISYADLSDYFYVWLRRSLRSIYPSLLSTIAVPKREELVASPYRHGNKDKAEAFFLEGMTQAMQSLAEKAHPAVPVTIYYAFKSSETETDSGTSSAGWEAFLDAVIRSGLELTGTWPMRTEKEGRMIGNGTNALASSIVLVCRKRSQNAITISRREFIREINAVLPEALDEMTCGGIHSPVAAVDLSQSIIGPGMAIFSKYAAVLEADGKSMSVRTALQLINRFLAEDDFDHDTQFCLRWFESFGWNENKFGEADVLARAKGTTVDGVREAGVIESKSGKVRLLKFTEYPNDWNPTADKRIPIWEALHHLIRAFSSGGQSSAGFLLARMVTKSEAIRQLAYRLYTLCERKGWAEDARGYNELITSWQAIETASNEHEKRDQQKDLFNIGEKNVA